MAASSEPVEPTFPKLKPVKYLEQYEDFAKNEMVFKLKEGKETLHTAQASMEALAKLPQTYVQEMLAKEYVKKKYLTEDEALTLFDKSTKVLKDVKLYEAEWAVKPMVVSDPNSLSAQAQQLQKMMPALLEKVGCPVKDCEVMESTDNLLWFVIQHCNDYHKMTRQDIADWLETLDVDLSFPVDQENT